MTDATKEHLKQLIDRYATTRVATEMAYARDAAPSVRHRYEEFEKRAEAELDAALDAVAEVTS